MLDKITKDVGEDILKEFLYADDLVLLGDSWWDAEKKDGKRKNALNEKGLSINIKKTKAFHTGQRIISAPKVDSRAGY